MTGVSHLSSGAIIGVLVANPYLAVPLAFGSHLLLDALPHYGERPELAPSNEQRWLIVTLTDGLLTLALAVWLALSGNWLALAIGLVAVSPDLPFIVEVILQRVFGVEKNIRGRDPFTKFHSRIQTLERPSGWRLEIIYALIFSAILLQLL